MAPFSAGAVSDWHLARLMPLHIKPPPLLNVKYPNTRFSSHLQHQEIKARIIIQFFNMNLKPKNPVENFKQLCHYIIIF